MSKAIVTFVDGSVETVEGADQWFVDEDGTLHVGDSGTKGGANPVGPYSTPAGDTLVCQATQWRSVRIDQSKSVKAWGEAARDLAAMQ